MKAIGAGIGFSIFVGLVWIWVREIHKDIYDIDTKVEMVDGTIYKCAEANSYHSGMTHIISPKNRVIVPTNTIKIIKSIKCN